MNKNQKIILILIILATALIVYTPHYSYPYPLHIDEWHHIAEAEKMDNGEYSSSQFSYRIGFQLILLFLSKFMNIVLAYKFFAASWATLTSLVLFYVIYKKTNNYLIAIISIIFFASLKSNVNLLGLWFFTPLTFSLPFIFLYMYFFDFGIKNQSKKYIIYSLLIMLILLPIHAVAVLFAFPILIIYSLFNIKFIKTEWKFFSLFLLVPLAGLIFYSSVSHLPLIESISTLFSDLQFKKGWGVLELSNSPLEVYSAIGYFLAIFGFCIICKNKEQRKEYLLYLICPVIILLSIIFFRIFDVSYLSPYQRNAYYFAISLPFLSAF